MATEPLYSPEKTAQILGISLKTLREHVKLGKIRSVLLGIGKKRKHRRFTDQNIASFIAKQKVREVPPCQSSNIPTPHFTKSHFGSTVIPFEALQKPPTRKKQKP